MEKNPTTNEPDAQFYRIRIKDHLDQSWSDWIDGLTIKHEENGETLLSGYLKDQSALFGIFLRIQKLGLTLLSVNKSDQL
jgi:hypothetical protein